MRYRRLKFLISVTFQKVFVSSAALRIISLLILAAPATMLAKESKSKVITDKIDIFDPKFGKSKYLPIYNHADTDGQGSYFLHDCDDGTLPFENATAWRKLKIINRNAINDPGYI